MTSPLHPEPFGNADDLTRRILEKTQGRITLALPLGLGKANTIVNALTRAALDDASIELSIFTALTLEQPVPSSELEHRFLDGAANRLFGRYPALSYARMLREGSLPDNITVNEFFLPAGRWLGVEQVQQNYIAANYTHAFDFLVDRKPNVVAQLLARDAAGRLSLGCNTDITTDLIAARSRGEASFIFAGEVNSELPFMHGPAADATAEVDLLLDDPDTDFELFSVVKQPVSLPKMAIGVHASGLVRDGGTLQVGIGAVGDAVAHALIRRHENPDGFRDLLKQSPFPVRDGFCEAGRFETGLYAATEMLGDGLLHMFNAGILRREVDGAAIHAGFFLESRSFYAALRMLPDDVREKIVMMPVSFTNALYGNEEAKRLARRDARFVNAAMMVTLTGAAISDGIGNGQVVSGVGGQFNFVSQAFALRGARSVLTLNATRHSGGRAVSNIVWNYPHTTIPRHLKDIVVTEYGVADLRGKSDADTIAALLAITDSRFQDALLKQARDAGKIGKHCKIPIGHRDNLPKTVTDWLKPYRDAGTLREYPFGTDFTETERDLLPALAHMKQAAASKTEMAALLWDGLTGSATPDHHAALQRMRLDRPKSVTERIYSLLLRGALIRADRP